MSSRNPRAVRVQDDLELSTMNRNIDGTPMQEAEKETDHKDGGCLKSDVLSRVFAEDFGLVKAKILDPRGSTVRRWNNIFLIVCLVSLFVDPLFLILPIVRDNICIYIGVTPLQVVLTIIRTIADMFYLIQILVRFRTAYVAPSSRVLGRGELVVDPLDIALRYLRNGFWLDFFVLLPLPQVLVWAAVPIISGSAMVDARNYVRFIMFFQYFPRLFLVYRLSLQILKDTGAVKKTAWAGAAYNFMLYLLACHVAGACWYLLAIERQEQCWRTDCILEMSTCQYYFFDCRMVEDPARNAWLQSSNVANLCNPTNNLYPYGIYGDASTKNITSSMVFFKKYFNVLWWGLRNLSSTGQALNNTSTQLGENAFIIVAVSIGLILLVSIIGNVQTYFQSTSIRTEEWRVKRTDTEQWMHHRQLPPELRQSVRQYDQYKWVATRGVDEEALLEGLPSDLRRYIKRHLCYDLVRRVPLFDQMAEPMLDAICERLKPALRTQGTCLLREGDPVNEMLFVIRGNLDSYTTNGGRTGFFNSCRIGPGDFCGEELLTWVLDLRQSVILPSSTRTVKAISDVEAFALVAEDLKFVASQFRTLHSKQLRHKFKFYSHQWRTWAACSIQAAWRRFKNRKSSAELKARENPWVVESEGQLDENVPSPGSRFAMYAAVLVANTKRSVSMHSGSSSGAGSALQKAAEPRFSTDEE